MGYLIDTPLQGYVLYAGQHPAGGLRDKPPKYVVESLFMLSFTNRNSQEMRMLIIPIITYPGCPWLNIMFSSSVRSKQVEDAWIASRITISCSYLFVINRKKKFT
jgi:hypothetical protein